MPLRQKLLALGIPPKDNRNKASRLQKVPVWASRKAQRGGLFISQIAAGSASSRSRYRLPDGRELVTLRDAATHITALPKTEAALPEWQAAIEALILVVEQNGPPMFARIGVMRALNRGHVREFNSSRKDPRSRPRKLKRDL
jgi:hypothetical protein